MPKNWFESPLGTRLLRAERHVAGELLNRVFGHYLVQYGYWGSRGGFLSHARTRRRILAAAPGTAIARPLDKPDLWAVPQRLPFASDSVDALLLPHTLEFTAEPHELLREAERILIGEGRLLVLGFNPWGLCGLRSRLSHGLARRTRFPWQGKMISERQMCDWLGLLGMDILTTRRYFFRPPISHAGLLERTRWLDTRANALPFMACGYAVLASKRLFSANPLRRSDAKQRRKINTVADPVARREQPSNRN